MAGQSVRDWLAEIGLEHYWGVFAGSGYSSASSLSSLNDNTLIDLGVLDANHRRVILNKSSPNVDMDFDSMLGDLSSVIKDLEAFSVPTHIDASTLPTNPVTAEPLTKPSPKPKPYVAPKPPPDQDFDLDSLLNDLTSFNPSDVVASTHAPLPSHKPVPLSPLTQSQPVAPPSPARYTASSSSPSTPHHNHMTPVSSEPTPTPPSTPGHVVYRSYTTTEDGRARNESTSGGRDRVMSESSVPRDGEEQTVVTVPQPDLSGATDQYSAEQVEQRLSVKAESLRNDPSLTEAEREMILKEEKMRIGIEKMKLAHKKRVAIKVFNPDRSNKTVVVEEGMTSGMVCHLLVVKNHFDESPNWVLVEQLGDVSLERELEDHECVVTVYSTWTRDHNNVFLFKQNEKKYDLFEDPIKYFPENLKSSQAAAIKQSTLERTEKAKKILLQEFFSSTNRVPELEGFLHLKDGYKKGWKKVYCILRASGLYYSTKGKQKTAKHLVLMVQFDEYELYHGINFKKTLKSPTEYCFALRPIPRQVVPGPKEIKVLCCDDEQTALSWTAGIRLAKYGLQLRDNFHKAKLTQFKLEDLTAPEGSKPKAENRASKLVGLRLEKHLDKLREQYQVQKQEEEVKRQHYHSPKVEHEGNESTSQSQLESSTETSATASDLTPERSPVMVHKEPPKPAPKPAPKPTRERSPIAQQQQQQHVNGMSGSSQESSTPSPAHQVTPPQMQVLAPPTQPQQPQVQSGPYNPYPPPSQPAPPPRVEQPQDVQTSPHHVSRQQTGSPDTEALFAFAWYHGSIPRDEAIRRLDSLGGYDGAYLVRDSTTVANSYVLTMVAKAVSKNFQIMPIDHPSGMVMYRIDDGPAFSAIDQLLRHYKQTADRLPCRLTEFCPRPPTRMTEC